MNKTFTLLVVGVIFLALLLMVLNSFSTEEQLYPVPPVAAEKARPQHETSLPRGSERVFTDAPSGLLNGAASADIASRTPILSQEPGAVSPSSEGVAVKTVPAQIDSGQPNSAEPLQNLASAPIPKTAIAPKIPVASESAPKRAAGPKNISNTVIFATQEGATLRLTGDHPLLYKSMLLSGPDRLVLDLEGQWNMSAPSVPQNRIIKTVRVGRQAESTRVVIDLQRAPASYRLIKTSPQGLDIRIR